MSRPRGTKTLFILLSTIALLATAASPVSALSVSVGEWSGPAFPQSGPAVANITVSYPCGQVLPPPLGGDILIEIEPAADTQGFFSTNFDSHTPTLPPECTPGESASFSFDLGYFATAEEAEGSTASATVRAIHDAPEPMGDTAEATASPTIGAFLDITFSAGNTSFDAIGGDTVSVEITVTSGSNTDAMVMPTVTAPDGWDNPRITPPTVAPPLDGADGTATIRFDVNIPEDAESGEYTATFSGWAHTLGSPSLESDTVEIPLTFSVTSLAEIEGEAEESPGPVGLIVPLVALVALVAAHRRRR
jgi:hypothetical protein